MIFPIKRSWWCLLMQTMNQTHGAKMPCSKLWQMKKIRWNTGMSKRQSRRSMEEIGLRAGVSFWFSVGGVLDSTQRQSAPGFEELHKGQLKTVPWISTNWADRNNQWWNQWRTWSIKIFKCIRRFYCVEKPNVHHVVWFAWAKFPKADYTYQFLAFWEKVFFTLKSLNQITFAWK